MNISRSLINNNSRNTLLEALENFSGGRFLGCTVNFFIENDKAYEIEFLDESRILLVKDRRAVVR